MRYVFSVEISRAAKRPKSVLVDSSLFGQVLVSGPHILSFLTSLARDGRISLFIPQLVIQEVRSNIPKWVKERLYRNVGDNNVKEARRCNLDIKAAESADVGVLCAYESACVEIGTRFDEWLKQSMCEELPLTLQQAEDTWANYFSGGPPFDVKKNKEHLPDAHIFQVLKYFSESHGPCSFISSDNNLCSHAGSISGVEIFRTPSELFEALGLSTTFKEARASLPKLGLITPSDEQIANAVETGLTNRHLALDNKEWTIERVAVSRASTRPQSTTPMLGNNLLVGISATADLRLILKTRTSTSINIETASVNVELEGGIVIRGNTMEAELDEFTFLSPPVLSDEQFSTSPCDATVRFDSFFDERAVKAFPRMTPGLILVTGGNSKDRRKMAEKICVSLRNAQDKPVLAVRLFPLNEPVPEIQQYNLGEEELLVFASRMSPDIILVEESKSCDLEDVLTTASCHPGTFIIFALGTCSGTDAAIRAVSEVDIGIDGLHHLEAVANFTKRNQHGAIFNFHTDSQWGGSNIRWHSTLVRDEWLKKGTE